MNDLWSQPTYSVTLNKGKPNSSASTMVDDWYAVEAIDPQTFAINEPRSRPDHPHPLINAFLLAAER
jgi:hypothetical protein